MFRLISCVLLLFIASKGITQNKELLVKLKEMNRQTDLELNNLIQKIQSNPNLSDILEKKEMVPSFTVSNRNPTKNQEIKKYSNKDIFNIPPPKNLIKNNNHIFEDNYKNFVPIN